MKRKFFVCLIIIVALAGCESVSKLTEVQEENVEIRERIERLTSDGMKGRLTGSAGNDMAVTYLEEKFKEIELKPFRGQYLFEYPHHFFDPDQQLFEIKIYSESGQERELQRGMDYLERSGFTKYAATYPITFDIHDAQINESFIVLEKEMDFSEGYNQAKGVFIVGDVFNRTLSIDQLEKPVIQINSKTYDLLQEEPNVQLSIESQTKLDIISAYNVVGRIPGKDQTKAVVLSAHFDHVGWLGNSIYRGAIDNASGVAILIDVAQRLKEYAENNGQFEKDIIIVAFNGEESNLQGSSHFVESIKSEYKHLYNINLDSFYDAPLEVYSRDGLNQELVEDIHTFFGTKDLGIKINVPSGGTSDHISFLNHHITAVSISSQNILGKIHQPLDTSEQINYDFLAEVSEDLFQFLIQHDHKQY